MDGVVKKKVSTSAKKNPFFLIFDSGEIFSCKKHSADDDLKIND